MNGAHTSDAYDTINSLGSGDTVLVTRTLSGGQVFRFRGVLDLSGPAGGFTVTGEDPDTGFRTTGYFLREDTAAGVLQQVERVGAVAG
ncbi:hypothetical protein ACFYWY_38060 [Streptomyces sp. NPDC002870]|uniref:hypothetical protein n=1 Tax=Streptomyces sp. NPDC002870 TaxID=3364666 RepID=UPI00368E0445